jgi:hypothetical protein
MTWASMSRAAGTLRAISERIHLVHPFFAWRASPSALSLEEETAHLQILPGTSRSISQRAGVDFLFLNLVIAVADPNPPMSQDDEDVRSGEE